MCINNSDLLQRDVGRIGLIIGIVNNLHEDDIEVEGYNIEAWVFDLIGIFIGFLLFEGDDDFYPRPYLLPLFLEGMFIPTENNFENPMVSYSWFGILSQSFIFIFIHMEEKQ